MAGLQEVLRCLLDECQGQGIGVGGISIGPRGNGIWGKKTILAHGTGSKAGQWLVWGWPRAAKERAAGMEGRLGQVPGGPECQLRAKDSVLRGLCP